MPQIQLKPTAILHSPPAPVHKKTQPRVIRLPLFSLNVLDLHRRRAFNGNIRQNPVVLPDVNNSSAA